MQLSQFNFAAALLGVATVSLGCFDSVGPPAPAVPGPTTTGAIEVTATTTGAGLAPNLYTVEVELNGSLTGTGFTVVNNATRTITELQPGEYVLNVFDLPPHCEPAIPFPRKVTVAIGHSTKVSLDVACRANSQLAFVNGDSSDAEIYVINTDGTGARRLTSQPGADVNPAWSPDGNRIAFASERDGNFEIYVMNADGTNPVRLTNVAAADYRPVWSPDGARIAFVSERDGNAEIYVINADGTSPVRLTSDNAKDNDPGWSPDGSRLAFASDRGGRGDVYVMNADGSAIRAVTSSFEPDVHPRWSPDGTAIAVSSGYSSEDRRINVFDAGGSGLSSSWLGHTAAGWDPAWSADGRKIAFTMASCGWYDYGVCSQVIEFMRNDGRPNLLSTGTLDRPSEPTWRP